MSEGQQQPDSGADLAASIAERRRHKRFLDDVKIRFRDLEGVDPAGWGHSRDLSLGGVCIIASDPVPLGCHLAMEVHIRSETSPILALGRVVRLVEDPNGDCLAGVEFLWISEEDRANLTRLAAYFRSKYGEAGEL